MPITPDSTQTQPTPDAMQQPPVTPSPHSQPTAQDPNAAPQVNMPAGAPPNLGQAPTQMPKLAQQPDKPHIMSRVFDGILKTMIGGPVTYTDPSGVRREAPQSRGAMGKAIVAAALAGLMTPTQYREGAFGTKVEDFGATAGNAANAAKGVMEANRNRPQQLSDEMQARKLMTIQNNAHLAQLQAASAHAAHEMNEEQAKNAQDFNSVFDEYDKLRTPTEPKAYLAKDLTAEEVTAPNSGYKLTDSNIVRYGSRTVYNPQTQQDEIHPTFAILNPDLKDIQLSPDVANKLAEINSQWKDIHQTVGGTVRVPVNAYVSAMHDYQAVTQGQSTLNALSKAYGDGKSIDLAAAVRNSKEKRNDILPALYTLTQTGAAGHTLDNRPDSLLTTLRDAPNGTQVLALMGMTPADATKKIEDIQNQRARTAKLAAEGGIGDKAPAPPQMVSAVIAEAKKLPPEDANAILAGINPQGMTVGELEKLKDKVLTTVQQNKVEEFNKLKETGDPVQAAKTASNIIEGDVDSLVHSTTLRGQSRQVTLNAIHDEAVKRGLDPVNYSEQALEAKGNMMRDFMSNKKGSTGSQLSSFDAFLGHEGAALDALDRLKNKTLGLSNSPVWNAAMDSVGKQLTNDPDWKAFKTSLLPVQNEINNFLSGGFAVQAHEQALMQQVLDPHETPSRVDSALRQLAETADIRLGAMGRRYLDVMGTTYPHLIGDDAQRTLKRVGIQSKAVPLSVSLPKGWKSGQAQPLTNPTVAKSFVQAAGGNNTRAAEIAKDNGWTGF